MDYPQYLKTPRLLLGRIAPGDREHFTAMCGDPGAGQRFERHIEHWARRGYGWWTVQDPHTEQFLGCGGLQAGTLDGAGEIEVAYAFPPGVPEFEYAGALVRLAVAQGFVRLGVREVIHLAAGDDAVSRRVIESAGFRAAGQVRHAQPTHVRYCLTATAWCALAPAPATPSRAAALQAA